MNDTPTTPLVAERDESIRAFLLDNLAADGYDPLGAQTEEEARLKLRNHGPALLLLGRLGKDRRTLQLLRAIRSGEAGGDPTVPVIVLGERDEELELLRAFEAGCDHFMPKPFSYMEVRARVRACIGRTREWRLPRRLVVGALVVDRDARKALHAGQEVWLSQLEFDLLGTPGRGTHALVHKWQLLRDVWGFLSHGNTRTVDAHACRLRRKLATAGAPHLVLNIRGVGYLTAAASEGAGAAAGSGETLHRDSSDPWPSTSLSAGMPS
jgi:DNA-binding response OmpR family regulator